MKVHSLAFKARDYRRRKVGVIQDYDDSGNPKTDAQILEEALLLIRAICADRGLTTQYIRVWNRGGMTYFDFGSHYEFFRLVPEVKLNADTNH